MSHTHVTTHCRYCRCRRGRTLAALTLWTAARSGRPQTSQTPTARRSTRSDGARRATWTRQGTHTQGTHTPSTHNTPLIVPTPPAKAYVLHSVGRVRQNGDLLAQHAGQHKRVAGSEADDDGLGERGVVRQRTLQHRRHTNHVVGGGPCTSTRHHQDARVTQYMLWAISCRIAGEERWGRNSGGRESSR